MRNRFTILALLATLSLQAQISEGGFPLSFQEDFRANFASKANVIVQIPTVDKEKLMAEDSRTPGQTRFAAAVAVDISSSQKGAWFTLPDQRQVWQCTLQSSGAVGLTLLFDQFLLPEGVQFYAYTPDKSTVLGAFTSKSCLPSGKFLVGILPGETAVLEMVLPAHVKTAPVIHLNRVDVSYDKHGMNNGPDFDFGQSLPCNVNINCPAGANWQQEKKGIARILMVFQGGEAWCSGTLIANTSGSFEPYFLTAHHCQLLLANPEFDLWRFDFELESANCSNPPMEPSPKSVLGCERMASRTETDFMLLKLNPIPQNYEVYFNGWNRDNSTTSLAAQTTMIHHPQGDIKKITIDTQAAVIHPNQLNWGGVFGISPANTHWKTIPDIGIQQPGSSGSPLFDNAKRIRGQLHGGSVSQLDPCIMTGVYYGRFNQSWDQGASSASRLKEWLDPTSTNAITQNGYLRPVPAGFDISGTVKTHWGTPMSNVRVRLSDSNGSFYYTTTDTSGFYLFDNVAAGHNFTLTPQRDTNDLNGVTTFDLVLISKHILGIESLNSPWKMLASDVNKSNSVTTSDIVEARKVILGISPTFPANDSWRFFPEFAVFADPTNPFLGSLPPNNISITNLQTDYTNANFKGIKIGDSNNTADPGQ
ncbi:MAG: hypothetical protein JNJ57_09635 [Saprospiraceae bacterium]|nr:hypothetical protein [Saprospiraceae bacterium]